MGQRTQIVVQRLQDFEKDGQVETKVITDVYHNQWGYGKNMLRDVINIINVIDGHYQKWLYNMALNNENSNEDSDNFGKLHNINSDFGYTAHTDQIPLMTNVSQFKNFVSNLDNNNGYCLLKLKCDKYGYILSGEYFFFKGSEECWNNYLQKDIDVPASRVISAKEYIDCCYSMDISQWEINSSNELVQPKPSEYHTDARKYLNIFRDMTRYYNVKPGRLLGNTVLRKEPKQKIAKPINIEPTI